METGEVTEPVPAITFAELASMPEPVSARSTRSFETKLGLRSFTIKADGRDSAETFFALTEAVAKGVQEAAAGLKVAVPGKPPHVIRSASMISTLYILAAVAVEPEWGVDQWALFGRKCGGQALQQISDWACEENGLGEYYLAKMEAVKKNG